MDHKNGADGKVAHSVLTGFRKKAGGGKRERDFMVAALRKERLPVGHWQKKTRGEEEGSEEAVCDGIGERERTKVRSTLEIRGDCKSAVDWGTGKAREGEKYSEAVKGVQTKMWEWWSGREELVILPGTSCENRAMLPKPWHRKEQHEKEKDG